MAKGKTISSPLPGQGTSQKGRSLRPLQPDYAPIFDKKPAEFLQYISEVSEHVRYYNFQNFPFGNWKSFFDRDISFILAELSEFDLSKFQIKEKQLAQKFAEDSYSLDREKVLTELFLEVMALAELISTWTQRIPDTPYGNMVKESLREIIRGNIWVGLFALPNCYEAMFRLFNVPPSRIAGENLGNRMASLEEQVYSLSPLSGIRKKFETEGKVFPFRNLEDIFQYFERLFDSLYRTAAVLQKNLPELLEQTLNEPEHQPQIALNMAFREMLKGLEVSLNGFTQRHLDFFYRKVLLQKPFEAKPDLTFITLKSAPNTPLILVPENSLLAGPSTPSGKKVIYRTTRDQVVNHALPVRFKTIFNGGADGGKESEFSYLKNSPVADTLDGLGKKFPDENGTWPPFGTEELSPQMHPARIGWALGDPMLCLAEGTRKITLTLNFRKDSFQEFSDLLHTWLPHRETQSPAQEKASLIQKAVSFSLTSAKKWLEIEPEAVRFIDPPEDNEGDKSNGKSKDKPVEVGKISIDFTLSALQPSIVPHNPAIHGEDLNSNNPVLRMLLDEHRENYQPPKPESGKSAYLYNPLRKLYLEGYDMEINVEGLKKLTVRNAWSALDPKSPAPLFGTAPSGNDEVFIGSVEAFRKPLTDFCLILNWSQNPKFEHGFADYYSTYNEYDEESPYYNSLFRVSFSVLGDKTWSPPLLKQVLAEKEKSPEGESAPSTAEPASNSAEAPTFEPLAVEGTSSEKKADKTETSSTESEKIQAVEGKAKEEDNSAEKNTTSPYPDIPELKPEEFHLFAWETIVPPKSEDEQKDDSGEGESTSEEPEKDPAEDKSEAALQAFLKNLNTSEPKDRQVPEESSPLVKLLIPQPFPSPTDPFPVLKMTEAELRARPSSERVKQLLEAKSESVLSQLAGTEEKETKKAGSGFIKGIKKLFSFGSSTTKPVKKSDSEKDDQAGKLLPTSPKSSSETGESEKNPPKKTSILNKVLGIKKTDGEAGTEAKSSDESKAEDAAVSTPAVSKSKKLSLVLPVIEEPAPPWEDQGKLKNASSFDKFDLSEVKWDLSEAPMLPKGQLLKLEDANSGFIKMTLCYPAYGFGAEAYPQVATWAAQRNMENVANSFSSGETSLPRIPFIPRAKGLSLDYQAKVSRSLIKPESANWEFFHVLPFGGERAELHEEFILDKNVKFGAPFLHSYDEEGSLLIGLEKVHTPQLLNLLFVMDESTGIPDLDPPLVKWSWLQDEEWVEFTPDQVLTDSTIGLIRTGIISLNLNEGEACNAQRLCLDPKDKDLFWLRATVGKNARAACEVREVYTNAVPVEYITGEADREHLAQPLPPKSIKSFVHTIKGIQSVLQPAGSAGGRLPENNEEFYRRISERLRHRQRAVNAWDIEHIILQEFPGIGLARCLPHTSFSKEEVPGSVSVVVMPTSSGTSLDARLKPKIDHDSLQQIKNLITALQSQHSRLYVRNPEYEIIKVQANFHFKAGVSPGFALKKINLALVDFIAPWVADPDKFNPFESHISKAEIRDFLEKRPEVDSLISISLFKNSPGQDSSQNQIRDDFSLVQPSHPWSVLTSAVQHELGTVNTPISLIANNPVGEDSRDLESLRAKYAPRADCLIIRNEFIV